MSIAFYMDVQMESAVTQGLRLRSVDVLTAQEDGTDRLSDSDLLERARSVNRVLVTRDKDFLVETAHRQRNSIPFAGVIYAARVQVGIGKCVTDLELIGKTCAPIDLIDQLWRLPL